MNSNSIIRQAFRLLIPTRPMLVALCAVAASSAHAATTLTNTFSSLGTNTWTVPPGVTSVDVYCWGGGGGSGSARSVGTSNAQRQSGGGGAGGAFASTSSISVTPGNVIEIFIGAGGAGGLAGDLGGVAGSGEGSWFATPTTVFAEGGAGGTNATTSVTGGGGVGSSASSIGTIVQAGGNGAKAPAGGGGGGGGSAGDSSAGGNAVNTTGGTAGSGSSTLTTGVAGTAGRTGTNGGNPGNPPGGGAGGARPDSVAGDTRAGGLGGAGRVVLVYTTPFNTLTWLGDGVNNRWTTNAGNVVWDSNGDLAADADFVNLDLVTFDANGAANSTVSIDSTVQPTAATVNSGSAYTFNGAGKISGSATLTKDGFGDLTVNLSNDYTGDTALMDGNLIVGANNALGTGKIIFNRTDGLGFPTLAPDGATDRTLANGLWFRYGNGVNVNKLGDVTKTGRLTVNGAVDFGSGARVITVNGPVTFAGGTTNYALGATANGRFTKQGPGELTLTGTTTFNMNGGAADILNGTVIIDGVNVVNSDRVIPDASAGTIVRLAITNGGTLTVNNTGANLRSGRVATAPGGTNIVDIAGLVSMPTVDSANGYATLYAGATHSEMNFLTGGDFAARGVTSSGTGSGNTVFNFNGGILRARQNNSAFITGLSNVVIQAGGAFIDSQDFAIEIPQAMSGPGSLTKSGAGSLTLSGSNTFAGAVTVAAGKVFFTSAHQGTGGAVNTAGGTVGFLSTSAGNTAGISSVTQTGGSLEASFTGQSGVPSAVAGYITNLTAGGTVAINVGALPGVTAPATIPLLTYGSLLGSPTFTLGSAPKGYVGSLSQVGNTFFYNLTSIQPLIWAGTPTNSWDVNTSSNWTVVGNPESYGDGVAVIFNDTSAAAEVQLVTSVSPLTMLVTNNTLAYNFTNAGGGIFGATAITKTGTNVMRLGGANSYTGATTIKAGTLVLDSATALGASNGVTVVESGASVDFNNQDVAPGEEIRIAGSGVGGAGAWQNSTGAAAGRNGGVKLVLTANATVSVGAGGRSGITDTNGQVTTSGGNWTLTKVGAGQFDIENATANLGDVVVQEGILQTGIESTWNGGFGITLNPGTEFKIFRLTNGLTRNFTVSNALINVTGGSAPVNTLSGTVNLTGDGTFAATSANQLTLDGSVTGSGAMIKDNTGTVFLNAANAYTGSTVVSNGSLTLGAAGSIGSSAGYTVVAPGILNVSAPGLFTVGVGKTLAGNGTVTGDATVNGVLAPGLPAGTLTVNGSLALAGTANLEVGKFSSVLTNDQVAVSGALTLGGGLNVSLLPGTETLAVNDEFTLFSAGGGFSGAFSSTNLPSGYTWDTSTLGIDGKIKVLTVAPTITTTPTNLTFSVSGSTLTVSWPANYLGWSLQAQTNTLSTGLGTNWATIPGTASVTSTNLPIVPGNPSVFYRMFYQTP